MSTREDRLTSTLGDVFDRLVEIAHEYRHDAPIVMTCALDKQVKLIAAALEVTESESAANEQPEGFTVTLCYKAEIVYKEVQHHSIPRLGQLLLGPDGQTWRVVDVSVPLGSRQVSCRVLRHHHEVSTL